MLDWRAGLLLWREALDLCLIGLVTLRLRPSVATPVAATCGARQQTPPLRRGCILGLAGPRLERRRRRRRRRRRLPRGVDAAAQAGGGETM